MDLHFLEDIHGRNRLPFAAVSQVASDENKRLRTHLNINADHVHGHALMLNVFSFSWSDGNI